METRRLILRPPKAEDFEAFCAFSADEEVMEFLGGVASPEIVWRHMCTLSGSWSLFGYSMFSVIEKASGNWIGRLGPWQPHGWPGTEIGWGLARSAWGKGYGTEGTVATMDFAIDQLGWTELIHTIVPANTASARMAERLGSRILRQCPAPPPFEGMIWDVWGQSAEEWRVNRAKHIKPA